MEVIEILRFINALMSIVLAIVSAILAIKICLSARHFVNGRRETARLMSTLFFIISVSRIYSAAVQILVLVDAVEDGARTAANNMNSIVTSLMLTVVMYLLWRLYKKHG